jgi:hypothetical protein
LNPTYIPTGKVAVEVAVPFVVKKASEFIPSRVSASSAEPGPSTVISLVKRDDAVSVAPLVPWAPVVP